MLSLKQIYLPFSTECVRVCAFRGKYNDMPNIYIYIYCIYIVSVHMLGAYIYIYTHLHMYLHEERV